MIASSPADILSDKMRALAEFVSGAEDMARDKKIVDMRRLDREVDELCRKVLKLPPDQAAQVQPVMAELIGNLERLARTLEDVKSS